jgi:phosphoenolpyruvate synthase/pyruvate phosphate dikinase
LAKIKDVKDIEKKSLKKIFIATDDLYTRIAALLGNTEQVAIVLQEKEMKKELEEVIKIHQDQGGLYPKLEKALEIIYSVLSDELNINIKLLKQATVDEVMNYLSWKNFTNKDSLQDRFNLHALYYDLQGSHIITDSKAELIKDKLNNTKTAISGDINGQVAFKGVVKGKVKIVKGENDLKKLNYGDIIVTPMTQVSYTPYLKTINGIVTDEGGVTCHAAIISRELGKPCIIGTKIATQVLKDGDEVEVDTNEGVVRIIFKEK